MLKLSNDIDRIIFLKFYYPSVIEEMVKCSKIKNTIHIEKIYDQVYVVMEKIIIIDKSPKKSRIVFTTKTSNKLNRLNRNLSNEFF